MGIFSEFQSMAALFQEAGKMELYEKIAKLFEENRALKEKVSELEKKLKLKESMVFEDRAYWIKDGEKKDGPFCPHCWDADGLTIRLIDSPVTPGRKNCSKCKHFTKD